MPRTFVAEQQGAAPCDRDVAGIPMVVWVSKTPPAELLVGTSLDERSWITAFRTDRNPPSFSYAQEGARRAACNLPSTCHEANDGVAMTPPVIAQMETADGHVETIAE